MHQALIHADLEWRSGAPFSKQFSDIYFPPESPLKSVEEVFFKPNKLAERFSRGLNFSIGEIGFGTGLNFFYTLNQWRKNRIPGQKLSYLSCELYPLSKPDFIRANQNLHPEQDILKTLVKNYPPAVEGCYPFFFEEGNVELFLLLGDAQETLQRVAGEIDAWFLDGFSPKENREAWSREIFTELWRLSKPGASLSSFTAAGWVRRNLETVGFRVEKIPGFAAKKESLIAHRPKPEISSLGKNKVSKSVLIIGAGLAGCSVADSLAKRGFEVKVLDRGGSIAAGASGNAKAIAVPYLGNKQTVMSEFFHQGLFFFLSRVQQMKDSCGFQKCGALQLLSCYRLKRLYQEFERHNLSEELVTKLSQQEASDMAGLEVFSGGFFLPEAGFIDPLRYCRALLSNRQISFSPNTEVVSILKQGASWGAYDSRGSLIEEAESLVLANAWQASAFEQLSLLPLEPVRGQCMTVQSCSNLKRVKRIVCYDGYLTPAEQGQSFIGATYSHRDMEEESRSSDNRKMFNSLSLALPVCGEERAGVLSSRASFRTSTYDRMPYLGGLDLEGFGGLYLSLGFGSRGLSVCGLAGEIVAGEILGEGLKAYGDFAARLSPGRIKVV